MFVWLKNLFKRAPQTINVTITSPITVYLYDQTPSKNRLGQGQEDGHQSSGISTDGTGTETKKSDKEDAILSEGLFNLGSSQVPFGREIPNSSEKDTEATS